MYIVLKVRKKFWLHSHATRIKTIKNSISLKINYVSYSLYKTTQTVFN